MKSIIILSVLASLLNEFFVRNIPALASATSLVIIILIGLSILKILKYKEIRKYTNIYTIIYLNIIFFFIQALFIGFNPYMIKLVLYSTTIIILINYLNDRTMSLIYKLIIIISLILSIDIIIQGINLTSSGINLRNLRHYTLLDKQGYNIFYSFAIPILIINIYERKNIKDILILIITIIATLFFMQIKSFLYTIPIGLILSFFILKLINPIKVLKYITILSAMVVILISAFPSIIPNQVSTAVNYYILNNTSQLKQEDLKNLDTFIIRGEIWSNAIEHIKNEPIIGIGYGNYPELVKNENIVSNITGIVYEMPLFTESGLLTVVLEGGILGLIMHLAIIIWIIINTIKIRDINKNTIITTVIFFVFIVSNIVQDNLNYLYWFIISAQIYNTNEYKRKKYNQSNYIKGNYTDFKEN